MKIQDKDLYYGAALNQIAAHPTFTSINKVPGEVSLYQINDYEEVLLKFSLVKDENEGYHFSLQKDELDQLEGETFLVLICGPETICLLTRDEVDEVLDFDEGPEQEIIVRCPKGKQMRVHGPGGRLSHTVAHNAFPKDIFGDSKTWPPFSRLNVYLAPPALYESSVDRGYDLADSLGAGLLGRLLDGETKDEKQLAAFDAEARAVTVYLGVSMLVEQWRFWREGNIKDFEEKIIDDLSFDGYGVKIERIGKEYANNEYVWKMVISTVPDDEEDEDLDEEDDDDGIIF